MSDNTLGIIILLGIIAIAAFGGNKNAQQGGIFSMTPQEQSQSTTEQKIKETQTQIEELKKQVQEKEDEKTRSKYRDIVKIQYVSRSNSADQEYITLKMDSSSTTTVPITGWKFRSQSSGTSVSIPEGTYLIFTNSLNTEDPIVLSGGDVVYMITGKSSNGYSFKTNKCSGYMSQFQTFVPYLYTSCPAPRDENLSSIPGTVNNDVCFDYIDSFPSCRIQTDPLPLKYSAECQKFIYEKINYSSCVDTHKNDKDFYKPEWRVYLKRSEPVWKTSRENIILYDNDGKIVDSFKY